MKGKKLFTAWGPRGGKPDTFVGGRGPLRFADGTVADPGHVLIWRIWAQNWYQACRKYHAMQGWDPPSP